MVTNLKVNTKKERSTDKVLTHGKMALSTLESGMKTESMAEASILGTMEGNTKATGWIITWTDTESTPGKTAENMKVHTKKTKSTAKECTPGLMAENMTENGKTEDNTEKESTYLRLANSEKAFGRTVRETDGLTKTKWTENIFI